MELKTLKDMEIYKMDYPRFIKISDLRQEAIKWMKMFDDKGLITTSHHWKHFFNITEEEMKGGNKNE